MKLFSPFITIPSLIALGYLSANLWIKNDALAQQLTTLQQTNKQLEVALGNTADTQDRYQIAHGNINNNTGTNNKSSALPQDCTPSESKDRLSIQALERDQLETAVTQKYQMLIDTIRVDSDTENALFELLAKRENILNMASHGYFTDPLDVAIKVDEQERQLKELDDEMSDLLGIESYERYELLKDSGFEQYQLREFDTTLSGDNILSPEQNQALLLAKLEYKDEYQQMLKKAENMITAGNMGEGFSKLESAVSFYKNNYLNEARNELTNEQFNELKRFEDTNFEQMLESLKSPYQDNEDD